MLCPKERIDDVVSFIDTYWKKDHAFVLSRALLNWQHYDPQADRYEISIAVHQKTGEIHAMVGVTLTSHFDPAITRPVRWGSMLKIRPDIPEPGLGLMVEWYKNEASSACAEVGLGESPIAIRLAKKTGAQTGVAQQYYMLHPDKQTFSIAAHTEGKPRHSGAALTMQKQLRDCTADYEVLDGPAFGAIPFFKSKLYYVNRYFKHPLYRYYASGIYGESGVCEGMLFWRLCEAAGARCIRIVDYFGVPGALTGCLSGFETLLRSWDAEYVDFLCVGMPPMEMAAAGFVERHSIEGLIIPNYFEPFVCDNVDVTYSCMGVPEAGVIFKGDSDQDRPNLIQRGK